MFRSLNGQIEVLLVHPGGPFWKNKDIGAWSIPKGEFTDDEEPLDAARREFEEETGFKPGGGYLPLQPIKLKSGKKVLAWAFEGDCDTACIKSNTFTMEWPPRSGRQAEFPEIDRAEFFEQDAARRKIKSTQWDLVAQLEKLLQHQGRLTNG